MYEMTSINDKIDAKGRLINMYILVYDMNSYRCTDGVGVKSIQSHTNGGQCSHNSTKSTKNYLQEIQTQIK